MERLFVKLHLSSVLFCVELAKNVQVAAAAGLPHQERLRAGGHLGQGAPL